MPYLKYVTYKYFSKRATCVCLSSIAIRNFSQLSPLFISYRHKP